MRWHGTFAATVRELDVDPSAVSHRVRALEADLRLRLFERPTRRVTPTRAGAILCDAALRSWNEAGRALSAALDLQSARAIRLSIHSSLAMRWLVPRLPAAAASGLDLSIDVREDLVAFDGGDVDAGLRFGAGPYPGLHSTHLARCDLQPVVGAGHWAAGRGKDLSLDDARLTLLSDSGADRYRTGTTWADYCEALDLKPVPPSRVRHFDRADLVLQAAIAGKPPRMSRGEDAPKRASVEAALGREGFDDGGDPRPIIGEGRDRRSRGRRVRGASDEIVLDRVIAGVGHNDIYDSEGFTGAMREALLLIEEEAGSGR